MESDTFYEECMVKLIWRLSGDLIYHVLSMNTPRQFQTNFTTKSPLKISLSTLSSYNLHINHSGNYIKHVFSVKASDKLHNFSILWRQHIFSSV